MENLPGVQPDRAKKEYKTLPAMMHYINENYNNPTALGYKENVSWKSFSTQEFFKKVSRVALGLKGIGVSKGDTVGIMSQPSPFWLIMDQAILSIGAITVPLFPNASSCNLEYQINQTGMKVVFLNDEKQWKIIEPHKEFFNKVVLLNSVEGDECLTTFEAIETSGAQKLEEDPNAFASLPQPREDDLATIIYTSGSTGVPKGVEISHKNLISQIEGASEYFPVHPMTDRALTALPLAHVFERMVTMYWMSAGISIYFAEDVKKIGDNLREISPSVFTLVPRLLEKVFAKMRGNVDTATGFNKFLGSSAFNRAMSRENSSAPTFKDKVFDRLVYSKMRAALGGKVRMAITGSAPLAPALQNFFLNIGVPIYEGYGCTETSPVLTANRIGSRRLGTVGKAFPNVEIKIAQDGEILAKGPNVMRCYYKNDEETKKVFTDDGYYQTGDLGKLDSDKFLTITGRKKDLFKTVNGKYVSPVPIESTLINKSKIVDLAMVVAEGRKYVTALIFPDFENIDTLKDSMGLSYLNVEDFVKSPKVTSSLQETIDEMNKDLNHWEKVQKFIVSSEPISPESGELTPSMKLRRHIVEKKFSNMIDSMYAD